MSNNTRMTKWTPTTDPLMLRRMGKLGEELGELQAVAARCIIQGIDEIDPSSGKTNRLRLEHETADVIAQCFVTIKALGLDNDTIRKRAHEKQRQMAEWEALFIDKGTPELRVCNNDECGWLGPLSDTVHPKHDPTTLLCPECKETTELSAPAAPEFPAMPEHWHVLAHINGDDILSLGNNWQSGKGELTEAETQAVIGMAQHLLSFVGYGLPPSSFDPDEAEPAAALTQGAAIAAGAGEAIAIMRAFQTNLGSCEDACNDGGRKMWRRIDPACESIASHGQAPAQPTAVPLDEMAELSLLNRLIELGNKAAGAHATANSDDGHKGTAAYVQWQEARAEMGELIRQAYAVPTPSPQAAQQALAGETELYELIHSFGHTTHNQSMEIAIAISDRITAPAAPSTPASGGWMPIETAPKDGRLILVHFGCKGVRAVSWDSPFHDEVTEENGIWCVDDDKHDPYGLRGYNDEGPSAPTHWREMPASPTIDGESNG